MTRFTPTPAPTDKSLFYAAILVSLALHLLLLLSLARNGLPHIPQWTPHALKVVLQHTQPAAKPPDTTTRLAQHDTEAGKAAVSTKAAQIAAPTSTTGNTAAAANTKQDTAQNATPPVLTREHSTHAIAERPPNAETPRSPQDWLNQARQLAPANNHAAGEAQDKAKAVYGVNATGVSWARYVEDWRLKIERIGKLNYPAEARNQNIYGSLELAVVINADGSLQDIRIRRSSGQPILDQAAEKIVRLAAPYPPFPPTLAAEFRSLEVVRKWSFSSANQLSTN